MPHPMSVNKEIPQSEAQPPEAEVPKDQAQGPLGPGGLSVADLESDPDIKFHLTPDPRNPKDRFVMWSRTSMSQFENRVWKFLGGKTNPWIFIPQVEICGFVVDFYSPVHRVVIEADGPEHQRSVEADKARDLVLLTKKGIKTMRLYPADLATLTPQRLFKVVEHFVDPANVVTEEMIRGEEGGSL